MWSDYTYRYYKLSPLQILGLTIYAEARGEKKIGMQAVLNVIQNRRLHTPITLTSKYGDFYILRATHSPYHAICLEYRQFSCYNLGNSQAWIVLKLSDPDAFNSELSIDKNLRDAMDLCNQLQRGVLLDITGGADHYCNPNETPASTIENWNRLMVYRTRIGNHMFWSEPPHISESPQVYHPEEDYVFAGRSGELLKVVVPSTIAGLI